MKKTAAMLMAIWMLALMLTACGQQAPEQTGGSVEPGAAQDQSVTGQVDASQPDEEELEMGSVNGGTYTNAFAGIGCALDETWVFYTKEQIAELNGFLTDGTSDEDMKKLMENSQSVQDMYASSTDGLITINVVFQNMGLLLGTTMSAQEYAELHVTQIPDAMAAYGFEDVAASVTTAELAGEERPAIALTATIQDIPVYELIVCLRQGNYIYCVTLCSYTEDVTAQMAELFYAL